MASLNVTHTGSHVVFTFSVGVDEIDLSQFTAGQQVSASTEPAPSAPPVEPPASPEGEPPAPAEPPA